jgi:hypothetical protein
MFGLNAIPTWEVLQTSKKNYIKHLVSVNGRVLYLYFPREKLAFLAHLDLKPCVFDYAFHKKISKKNHTYDQNLEGQSRPSPTNERKYILR